MSKMHKKITRAKWSEKALLEIMKAISSIKSINVFFFIEEIEKDAILINNLINIFIESKYEKILFRSFIIKKKIYFY